MHTTYLHIGELTIFEPVTSITDFLISALTFYFYLSLKHVSNKTESTTNWALFFLFMSLATFLGGFAHGFFIAQKETGFFVFWLPMQIVNCISIYFGQKATLASVMRNSHYKNEWRTSYIIQLIIFIPAIILFRNYLVTIIENVIGLVPIMVMHYRNKEKNRAFLRIGNSIAISFITAIVHIAKISFHDYFNNKDLAHVFIIISFMVLYKGIKESATSL